MMSDIPRRWPCFLSPHVAKIAFENGFAERDSSRGGRSFCPLQHVSNGGETGCAGNNGNHAVSRSETFTWPLNSFNRSLSLPRRTLTFIL